MGGNYEQHDVEVLLQEGALVINDGYRAKNSELSDTGIPFARAGNIDGGFHFEDADRVPTHTLAKVGLKRSLPGDVVFTSKGTVGRFAFVREETPEFVYSPQLCYWRSGDVSRIHPRWLFYWMNGREFLLQFKSVAGQTDMADYVSLRDQRAMKITLPPLPEQKAIAAVLGALDDKIELNRRMNATLEAMAQALFQSWFIDFDPVRRNADRDRNQPSPQPAGHPSPPGRRDGDEGLVEYDKLFPDSFQESELGPMPKSWEVCKFKDITSKIGSGATPRGGSEVYVDEGTALIRSQNVYDHEFHWEGLARLTDKSAVELKSVEVRRNDVLINITGDSILRTCVVDPSVLPARVNQHVAIIRAIEGIPPRYLHLYLAQQSMKSILIGMSAGATRHAITKGHLESIDVVKPSAPVLAAFETITTPWFDQIDANRTQSRTLATLRDTLLPKLLSGELCVDTFHPESQRK